MEYVTDVVLMVPPTAFCYNFEAAQSNKFQNQMDIPIVDGKNLTIIEFDNMVKVLEKHGIRVLKLQSRDDTPDAVFPNNWFSIHKQSNGVALFLYPMLNHNRRLERQPDVLSEVLDSAGIQVTKTCDFSFFEGADYNIAMEGTGSFVLDRKNFNAFVSLSPRADIEAANIISSGLGYKLIPFRSYDSNGELIYHTNVMMSIGLGYVVIADTCIHDDEEKTMVLSTLQTLGKEIISISYEQVKSTCGNILQLRDEQNNLKIVMSQTAYDAFTDIQKEVLGNHGELVPIDVKTIESIGGGSVRCMIAEIMY